jgi:hypothetical protein
VVRRARSLGGLSVAQLQGNNTRDQRLVGARSRRGRSSGRLVWRAAQDGGRANKRERKAEEGGLRIMKGSRNLVEAPDG